MTDTAQSFLHYLEVLDVCLEGVEELVFDDLLGGLVQLGDAVTQPPHLLLLERIQVLI